MYVFLSFSHPLSLSLSLSLSLCSRHPPLSGDGDRAADDEDSYVTDKGGVNGDLDPLENKRDAAASDFEDCVRTFSLSTGSQKRPTILSKETYYGTGFVLCVASVSLQVAALLQVAKETY